MELIYEKSRNGRTGVDFPLLDTPLQETLSEKYLRKEKASLPEVSELDVVRHYTVLSKLNFSVDTHYYPLGSCTMKYNPKATEKVAGLESFNIHPMIPQLPSGENFTQGALEVLYKSEKLLEEITGMDSMCSQPMAGAHGELVGIMLVAAYHKAKGNKKKTVIVPDSSHGTNPASAAMAGYEIITIPSLPNGEMDFDLFKEALNNEVAAVMMTCPNTLGIFETRIKEIADLAHSFDTLMYYDGANLNAIMGKVRPGDLGFDVVHINVHKTFGTPHGGGGPGAGPVGVKKKLIPYLPVPLIGKHTDGTFFLDYNHPESIGKTAPFYGQFGVLIKAYAYILLLGKEGLIDATEKAVLNANYLMKKLKAHYDLPYDRTCMHECVFSAKNQLQHKVHALDIAKYLIDQGIHPPTVYFPLIVKEAIMIEPTETESKETLDWFIDIMIGAAEKAKTNPEVLLNAPFTAPISRPNETKAAREINVNYFFKK
ncbi:MAG TPA: aminomethyl-transferring glycine dehydrogenase subunit GcvPB [Spirochaetia bacterium]|nr:MAG: glycine dehydrogenase (aminomethyl-transferring) [Spirochaetes bacterium GWB1_36_13]HCL56569.1 aminomethyl-transferring glycine dehydrogenase subunit GcvPB [Spirochaetia bacterium]